MSKADDNQFYLDAVTEFEGKNLDKALWAKCVTLAERSSAWLEQEVLDYIDGCIASR